MTSGRNRALYRALWVWLLVACRGAKPHETPPPTRQEPATAEVSDTRGAPVERGEPPAAEPASSTATSVSPLADPSFEKVRTREGRFTVCWRPVAGPIPRNEDFTLDVHVFEGETPFVGATLLVNARMPDHGHGMLRQPRTIEEGAGRYRVEGMLFHMRGHWVLSFDVARGSRVDTAECGVEL